MLNPYLLMARCISLGHHMYFSRPLANLQIQNIEVRDDPKLFGDSGEVTIPEWSGWPFISRCENFSLLALVRKKSIKKTKKQTNKLTK